MTAIDGARHSTPHIIDLIGREPHDPSTPGSMEADLLEAVVLLRAVSVSVDRVCAHDWDVPAALELFDAGYAVHRALTAARTFPDPAAPPAPAIPAPVMSMPCRRDPPLSVTRRISPPTVLPPTPGASTGVCRSGGTAATLPSEPAAGSPFGNDSQGHGFAVEWKPVADEQTAPGPAGRADHTGRSATR